ncbi:Y-family DNA polymerase [Coralloluteibacterium stylophorae]|uniref:DNA polymerase Y family protein n=1 Tax=Coralloluteibacterium stylophorae TaxID=1776034 RepID=A0A8J7VU49_9GAMM|nr:DNA polymerase Y family protein [Coralloluteibacterium stylophorae]MBS7455859.1 DNA polymerase Y family protein [Coralloluteibacterium stylophorae]
MLWACLHLPALAVEAVFADRDDHAPRAVHDPAHRHRRLVGTDPAAQALGIHPGLTSATARALAADLAVRPRDPAAERACLTTAAAMAYAFSGQVAIALPDAVLLEVGASLRLFGGWTAIDAGLREGLSRLGHAHRIAVAPTPAAAHAFASLEDGRHLGDRRALAAALRTLPLEAAGLPVEATALLARAGLRRLGEVLALPRADLLRRVGKPVGLHLDRLCGRAEDIRTLYRPPDRFERGMEFEYGIADSGALLFPLRRLVDALAAFLSARDGGVSRFVLRFVHEGAPRTELAVGLRKPMRASQALFDAARGRLERHALAAPAHGLQLVAEHLPPFMPELRDLFEAGSRGALDHDALVEHLRARLGDDSVRSLAVAADHRPERAWRVLEPGETTRRPAAPSRRRRPARALPTEAHDTPAALQRASEPASATAADARTEPASPSPPRRHHEATSLHLLPPARPHGFLPHPANDAHGARVHSAPVARRPLWLLPEPVPLRARIVRLVGGSERIESGWWDDADARRDYVAADLDTGQRAWLYREAGGEGWMLHGWFA